MTRSTSEKLASLELYNALHGFPINQETFWAAWQDILLFNEHTWGSHNSISAPDSDLTQKTWQWKSERAVNANRLTSQIWQQLIFDYSANEQDKVSQILVVNPHNIPIKQAVTVDNGIHRPGDQVVDLYGNLIDSQRLRNGALVFVAHLSPLEKRIYQITEGNASVQNLINFNISNNELSNNQISIKINPYKGAIESLVRKSDGYEFVNRQDNNLLAQHIYVPGSFGTIVQSTRNENIRVSVGESGPLVSSIRIDSQPHGSNSQILEIMLYQDSSRLDISFLLDRKKIRIKESVHYAFPLNIPNGSLFYDVPFGRVNLSQDMMPGGNRNFISVNRYLELSNDEVQATIVMQDAALVVPYKLNVDPKAVGWKNEFPEYNSKIYSYVMNNYWHTNFKADQEGLCQIRYSLWVGAKQDAAFSSKLATQVCQPLLVIPLKDGAVIPEEDVNLNSLLNQLSMHLDLEIVRLSEQSGVYEILLWNRSDQTQSVGSWTFAPYELKQYSFSLNFSQTL